jgi:hypothetical protein
MTQNLSLPGLSAAAADRLVTLLEPRVTSLTGDRLLGLPMTIYGAADPELERLGVHLSGNADVTVIVADPDTKVGQVNIEVSGPGNCLMFDNRAATGNLHANIRLLGSDSAVVFDRLDDGYISLHDVFMRSNRQVLLWGAGATAVGCNIEIEGDDRCVAIGEDALISSGIWIRNHDMHAVHDLRSGDRINRPPVDTILERHVWLGQNALLLNCQRIGTGSIVGAMSLVKGVVGECVAVAGAPARVIRYQVSWGRQASGMTEQERSSLGWKPV